MSIIPSTSELINAATLLAQGAIRQGMKVADLGCGSTGHFVFAASELVGKDGIVYAVDIQKGALDGVESRTRLEGAENVKTVWSDIEMFGATRIPAASLDLVLLVNNLFLAKNKSELAREIIRLMVPGGRLIVADWKMTQAPFGPSVNDRISPEEAKNVFSKAGMRLEKEFEAGKYHYGLVFVK
ncbi:MAG: methyltransferase domain-containing protein [Patescibacteria group bacterium]|nr:methyltransferase domain-containing protein [Patescibacteria group bacterium]